MPILDKMTNNNVPDDHNGNGNKGKDEDAFDYPRPEPVMRRPKSPEFIHSQQGRRQVTIAAILERIQDQFLEEHSPDDSAVRAAKTRNDRLKLLNPIVDYVMAVESLELSDEDKAHVIRLAYSQLFGLGPLDELIDEDDITTITLEGHEKISVRRGQGELEPLDMIFEDYDEMREMTRRILQRGGTIHREDIPLMEVGFLSENGRFVSASIAQPPIAPYVTLDIRVHPAEAPTLAKLIQGGILTEKAAMLLRALIESDYGFTLVGQPESGKTMMLSALLTMLPYPADAVSVERTGELHLPTDMRRVVTQWPDSPVDDGVSFGQQVAIEAEKSPRTLILDEVRNDEPETIAPVLKMENPPRLIWSVRGTPDSKRLLSALGMLARRSDMAEGDKMARRLFDLLPFVVSVRRVQGELQLREVGEWYDPDNSGYLRYRTLLENVGGELLTTGEVPDRDLGLDAEFWTLN